MNKKFTIKADWSKVPRGHQPHVSGTGPHKKSEDKRAKDKIRRDIREQRDT